MFVSNIEEPLQANEALYALNEESGRLGLCDFADARLNRYSFLWTGEGKRRLDVHRHLMLAIFEAWQMPATWLIVQQPQTTGYDRIRGLVWRSRHRKQGWNLYNDGDLALAAKTAEPASILEPPGYDWLSGKLLILFGPAPPLAEIATSAARASLIMIAKAAHPCPSREFLNWLADHEFCLAYFSNEDLGREQIVLVGPKTLNAQHSADQSALGE